MYGWDCIGKKKEDMVTKKGSLEKMKLWKVRGRLIRWLWIWWSYQGSCIITSYKSLVFCFLSFCKIEMQEPINLNFKIQELGNIWVHWNAAYESFQSKFYFYQEKLWSFAPYLLRISKIKAIRSSSVLVSVFLTQHCNFRAFAFIWGRIFLFGVWSILCNFWKYVLIQKV